MSKERHDKKMDIKISHKHNINLKRKMKNK